VQIEITKRGAATFMRWVIVLTLFGATIYQSNQIDKLKEELASKTVQYDGVHGDWTELGREYTALKNSCQK